MEFELKIGRHKYTITEKDRFLDNGSCVQLLTQSKEKVSWGRRATPVLSRRAVKEIAAYSRVSYPYDAIVKCQYFGLTNDK